MPRSFWTSGPSGPTKSISATHGEERMRFMGKPAPPPERFAKYPLENKLYHGAIIAAGLTAIVTGVFMMSRVRTIFFPRNPYLFTDMTWGMMYVLHGLAGVGLIALIMVHVYFGIRPEKRPITKSMIFGWMSRDFYLEEHDPQRWVVEGSTAPPQNPQALQVRIKNGQRCLSNAATQSKKATNSCWPTPRKACPRTETASSGSQIREFLNRAVNAISGLKKSCAEAISDQPLEPRERYEAFLAVVDRDARDSLAAIELVLAQPTISSQLIDNLNASIHLRALLTDLFLLGDILNQHQRVSAQSRAAG